MLSRLDRDSNGADNTVTKPRASAGAMFFCRRIRARYCSLRRSQHLGLRC